MKRNPILWALMALIAMLMLLTLDRCSRTKRPTSAAEAILYSAWQAIRYPGDNTDHYNGR